MLSRGTRVVSLRLAARTSCRRGMPRRMAYVLALVLVPAGALPANAMAASPHFAYATATMSPPTIVAPGNITWNTSLVVSFQVAGLSKSVRPTASLATSSSLNINQSGVNNTSNIQQSVANPVASVTISGNQSQTNSGGTNTFNANPTGLVVDPSKSTRTVGINVVQSGTGNPAGTNTETVNVQGIAPTLTSQKNGQLTGTLTIPGEVDASADGSECVQMSWSAITLTVGGLAVNLPTVSNQYDSTGSACGS